MTRCIITECPACTTRFQVTDGLLKIANGKVRCGACLEVFNAELYNTNPTVPVYAAESVTQSFTSSPPKTSNQQLSNKAPVFDKIEVSEFIAPQTRQSGIADKNSPSSLEQDKNLIEQLDQATDTAEPLTSEQCITPVTAASEEQELDLDKPIQEYIKQSDTANPATIKDTDNTDIAVQAPSDYLADKINLEEISNAPERYAQEKHVRVENTPDKAASAVTPEFKKAPPFTSVRAEPVMIRATIPSGVSGRWAFSCLIAALLLAGQYLWFNRVTLANKPDFANLYEIACQEIECDLPVRQDISSINPAKLVVQEHRQYQGALSVNLLLENQATYEQPYPAILLSFSDRKGIPISQRIFQPREYLHESINDLASMPVNQTIQINVDILDPGRRAVSYQVELKPASL